jgi:hypothetical protein
MTGAHYVPRLAYNKLTANTYQYLQINWFVWVRLDLHVDMPDVNIYNAPIQRPTATPYSDKQLVAREEALGPGPCVSSAKETKFFAHTGMLGGREVEAHDIQL